MRDSEFGICGICNKIKGLQRTYYHYNIKCECHSPNHFVRISHCKDCVPKEPTEIRVILKAKDWTF